MYKAIAGFTLVSLLIGITIITVVLSLTLANFSFLDQLLVRTELHALYATVCYAQHIAQVRGNPCEIRCDRESGSYQCDNQRRLLPRSVIFGVQQGLQGPPSSHSTGITHPITFKNGCIRATAHGTVNAGTLYLIDTGKRYQYALSSAVTQVPYIRCYHYDNGWNILK